MDCRFVRGMWMLWPLTKFIIHAFSALPIFNWNQLCTYVCNIQRIGWGFLEQLGRLWHVNLDTYDWIRGFLERWNLFNILEMSCISIHKRWIVLKLAGPWDTSLIRSLEIKISIILAGCQRGKLRSHWCLFLMGWCHHICEIDDLDVSVARDLMEKVPNIIWCAP